MADLFDGYPLGQQWDEMFGSPGQPRSAYAGLFTSLQPMAGEELSARADLLSQTYRDAGVTFAHAGEEQPFPLDIVPRVIGAEEWDVIERGVAQRVLALEAFLADVYGAGEVFADRVVPRSVVTTSAHFHRQAHGLVPPNGVRVHVSGIDLVRDEAGDFRVLEDNLRSPSGVSYVITNRAAMSQVLPELFADHRIQPVDDYPTRLLAALKASAPANVADPTVVVLTPGVYNSAYFEHALLARQMGVELVEGRDLVCAGNQVSMRTTDGQRRVDVVYRRIDDEFLDPVHFRPDSVIGCAGLLNAARAGRVTIANAVGNGVADDKLLFTWVPDLVRYYLGEEPVLANAETYRLDDRETTEWVLSSLDQLVLKPVDGSGGKGIVIGPRADEKTLADLAVKVRARPRDWIAQKPIGLSTCPTLIGGRIAPRHVDLRPFAVNDGSKVWVLPGGLTRVALPEGELVVNSSQGGGSKDTWVLSGARPAASREVPESTRIEFTAADLPDDPPAQDPGPLNDTVVGQSQQQQQGAFRARNAPEDGGTTPC
ncbi:circularly permuted type 2 ATP-grasp protein [Blastococcus sp. URHD0036]|uniref:circularly permuted type 2 ATP-grasp protein n=1 Tax=Blastococcus sp. URHD0036 TaxID=1380356 RepID=UPI0006918193|nr:circularly permuted type 2 ATP-grasp protein [Blastococcus sp. URHD0036]